MVRMSVVQVNFVAMGVTVEAALLNRCLASSPTRSMSTGNDYILVPSHEWKKDN